MLSVADVKKILHDENISDEDAESLRDGCRAMVELIFENKESARNTVHGIN